MPTNRNTRADSGRRAIERLDRRSWPIAVALVYVTLGMTYIFRWGPVVRHQPSWLFGDLWYTYGAASEFAHGQFGNIYQTKFAFLALPALLILLVPIGALSKHFPTTLVEVTRNSHPKILLIPTNSKIGIPLGAAVKIQGHEYWVHPPVFVYLALYSLLLSCLALFACDALAERLGVSRSRRSVLCLTEAVLLWNVTVFWGHPEDAVALALAVYALDLAMGQRFNGAGWLFGLAVAFQPLVIVTFPMLLVLGGRKRLLGLVARGILPVAVAIAAPLVANAHTTIHALVTQPTYPDLKGNHQTPWTFLASRLGGQGAGLEVRGGALRIVALVLAAGLGWWARRWQKKPELIVFAVALALALRTYTESVMTDYYVWPALAVGLIVAARRSRRRFEIAVAVAIVVTVIAQWRIGWLPWWSIDVAGVTGFLVLASRPAPEPVRPSEAELERGPVARVLTSILLPEKPVVTRGRAQSDTAKNRKKNRAARASRKRSVRR